jgi:tRNA 2-thiouridine synthesizing protein A
MPTRATVFSAQGSASLDRAGPRGHHVGMEPTCLDLSGLKCPLPALKTRKALKSVLPGEVLVVVCTDPMSAIDIPNLVRETGDILLASEKHDKALSFSIRKAE